MERILTVQTDPPGALVELNGREMGTTPVSRDFTWYGWYGVVIRKQGYETVKTTARVIAPFYEWVPLDLVSELLPIPLKDHRTFTYTLKPKPDELQDSGPLMQRSDELKAELQGQSTTRPSRSRTKIIPATAPVGPASGLTAPATQPAP